MKLYLCTIGLLLVGLHTICAQVYRGFNINSTHFATLAGNTPLARLKDSGANVIRLSFGYRPLVNKTPPYDYNLTSFEYLENALNFCEANGIKVIINPHTPPGTADNYTMYPTDPFWTDPSFHTYLYNLWDTLAVITKDRGDVIYGLDLLNELEDRIQPIVDFQNAHDGITGYYSVSSALQGLAEMIRIRISKT